MNKTRLHSILTASFLVAVMVLSLAACSTSRTQSPILISDAEILSQVKRNLESVAPLVKSAPMDLWWVTLDGYSIINDSSPGVEAQFPGCVNDDSKYSMWKDNAIKTVEAVDAVMEKSGFMVDETTNSSKSLSDSTFYDYIKAYYREATKAVLSISHDCGSTMATDNPVMYYSASFGYTKDYQKNYDLQAPFLSDLGLKDVIVHVMQSEGDFRVLAVNYRRTGHATIVQSINGRWTELWSGQDLISCAVRNEKKIPLSIAPDCYKP